MVNAEKRRRTTVPSPTQRDVGRSASLGRPASGDTSSAPGLWPTVRYRLDLALARGPLVVIGYLGVVMVAIIVVASTILWGAGFKGVNGGPAVSNPGEAFWQAMLRVLDSGTFASDSSWPTRIVSLSVTLAGIFLAGSLIGLIANAVDQQIEQLRKGRSAVLETGHTLVIGWSPRLPTILTELVEVNSNQKRAAVVVLANVPKDEMEDERAG